MPDYKKTKIACYLGFITQAIAANFAPLLFLTFHNTYQISLGRIALIPTCFFFTQLLVDLFCAKWGESLKWINQYDGGPHEANFLKLDCSKIKRVFGWRPRWGVEEAIEKTVEWSKIYFAGGDIPACMDGQIKEFFVNKIKNK